MKYRADIDGLRAVAILPVLLFHIGAGVFSGGFVGVDIFFVISGYIIARTLLDDLEARRFSILTFYERRIRRIFPALLFVMLVTFGLAWALLLPSDFRDYSKSQFAASTFISNFYFWKNSGYFENSALLRPLLHTWSLSVEEQFYLFMPIAMWVIHRYLGARWRWWLLPAAIASFALSVVALKVGPTANFFLLPTRAWELLLGALLAVSPPRAIANAKLNELLSAAAIAMIAYAVFVYTEATPFPGPNALLPCLGAALLIYVGGHHTSRVHRVLMLKPMVGIGLISYSLYLVHWPMVVFLRYYHLRAPSYGEMVLIALASVALAVFSWKFIEQPFRKPKHRASRRAVLMAGVVVIAFGAGLGAVGVKGNGFPNRFPDYEEPVKLSGAFWRNGTCFFEEGQDYYVWDAKACTLVDGGKETVMLWGDSFAAHYVPGILAHASRIPYRVLQHTAAGCPPVLAYESFARPQCHAFNQHALKVIQEEHVTHVILSGRWVGLQGRGLAQLKDTIAQLKVMGVRVTVLGQSPVFAAPVRIIAYRKKVRDDAAWLNSNSPALNNTLRAIAADAEFINPTDRLCTDGQCAYRQGGKFLYSDAEHLSQVGSRRAVEEYFPLFEASAKRHAPVK